MRAAWNIASNRCYSYAPTCFFLILSIFSLQIRRWCSEDPCWTFCSCCCCKCGSEVGRQHQQRRTIDSLEVIKQRLLLNVWFLIYGICTIAQVVTVLWPLSQFKTAVNVVFSSVRLDQEYSWNCSKLIFTVDDRKQHGIISIHVSSQSFILNTDASKAST